MPQKNSVRLNVDVSPDTAKNFSDACYWARTTKSNVLRTAIDKFIKTQEKAKS